jgi:hypothetical protein
MALQSGDKGFTNPVSSMSTDMDSTRSIERVFVFTRNLCPAQRGCRPVSLGSTGPDEDNQIPPAAVLSATGAGSKEGTEPQQAMVTTVEAFGQTRRPSARSSG